MKALLTLIGEDGGESDLDLGNYERYLGLNLNNENNITTGKIYKYAVTYCPLFCIRAKIKIS